MRKIIFNKKFLAIVGICLSVAGGFAIKQKITTKASDHSFEVNGMNVSIQQCEGKSEEIMEEDLDETISNEVMALEEKGPHAMIELRKHLGFYLRGTRDAARLRTRINTCKTLEELEQILGE